MEHPSLLRSTEARLTARLAWLVALLVMATLAGAGCRKATKPAATAEEAAQTFVATVQAGDLERAAAMMDYEANARSQNENWDDIPPGQRGRIVAKLREDQAVVLRQLKSKFGADLKIAGSMPGPSGTRVTLTGTGGSLSLDVVQTQQGWRVLAVF